jgi:hypothetical protein
MPLVNALILGIDVFLLSLLEPMEDVFLEPIMILLTLHFEKLMSPLCLIIVSIMQAEKITHRDRLLPPTLPHLMSKSATLIFHFTVAPLLGQSTE